MGYTVWATKEDGTPVHGVEAINFAGQLVKDLEPTESVVEKTVQFCSGVDGGLLLIRCTTNTRRNVVLGQLGNMKTKAGFGWKKDS